MADGFATTRLTKVARVQVLTEVGKASPGQDEKVNLEDEASFFRSALEGIPNDVADPSRP